MVDAATYIAELENKNQESITQLARGYAAVVAKEGFQVTDVLKLELKVVLESIEIAALWLPDTDDVEAKVAFAARCGDGAQQFAAVTERLAALGLPLSAFDARQGGYSKLFAFCRSLQTMEERTSAALTQSRMNFERFDALAAWCEERGDLETAHLYRSRLVDDERRHVLEGRERLIGFAINEESQARARRAAYRTIELLGEVQDPTLLRKFLSRSIKR